jgi:hypothetical protein
MLVVAVSLGHALGRAGEKGDNGDADDSYVDDEIYHDSDGEAGQ